MGLQNLQDLAKIRRKRNGVSSVPAIVAAAEKAPNPRVHVAMMIAARTAANVETKVRKQVLNLCARRALLRQDRHDFIIRRLAHENYPCCCVFGGAASVPASVEALGGAPVAANYATDRMIP